MPGLAHALVVIGADAERGGWHKRPSSGKRRAYPLLGRAALAGSADLGILRQSILPQPPRSTATMSASEQPWRIP
ncbi:hypothetical protein, partial [Halochromatium glycolicum]